MASPPRLPTTSHFPFTLEASSKAASCTVRTRPLFAPTVPTRIITPIPAPPNIPWTRASAAKTAIWYFGKLRPLLPRGPITTSPYTSLCRPTSALQPQSGPVS